MGKSRAEIQREYRARKKAKEGDSYKQKERERVKKYYVPIDERPKKEQKSRREYVKKCVKRHRQLQEIAKRNIESQNENEIVASTSSAAASSSSTMDSEVTSSTDVCSSNVSSPCLVVKLPNLDPKKRTRKRISRATARNRREIERLKLENENMQRRYKTVSKRYERLRAKVNTSFFVKDGNAEDSSMPQHNIPTIRTPRKRTSTELRKEGVTPTKLPKVVLKKLVMANVVAGEIENAWKSNSQHGKKIISRIISGKIVSKYRFKRKLGNSTGIKRSHLATTSKTVVNIPRIKKRVAFRNKLREDIVTFLERDDNSRMMPGKADKIKVESGNVQKRVLNDNMANLHLKFKSETNRKISLSTFCRMRPKNFCLTKYITRNKCLCQKHQNMALLLKSTKSVGGEVPLNPDEYARMLRDTNPATLITKLPDGRIKYNQWAKVDCNDGKKRTKVVEKELDKNEYCNLFLKHSAEFKEHVHKVNTQYRAITELKDKLPTGHVIVQMDFSENYSCASADEVQSAYWNANSVTLHPTVVYHRTQDTLEHKSYMFVSDDNGHNIGAVYSIMKKLVPDVKDALGKVDKIHYWTDSPSSQYRNKTAFYLTSVHEQLLDVPATWDYFEAGHGKGPCDGLGGAAKRMADLAVKQGKVSIQDATDFFIWGNTYQTSVKYIFISKQDCDQTRLEIAEMNKKLAPVKGTLQIHSVTPVGLGKIRTSVTSCYCEKCLDGNYHDGIVTDMVQKQKIGQSMPTADVLQEETTRSCDVENDEVANNTELNESLKESANELVTESNIENEAHILQEKDWVAVKLEGDWFIGKIIEVDTESKDYKITFMRKSNSTNIKQTNFKWPMPADELWVKCENILLKIKEPIPFGRSSRSFDMCNVDLEKILKIV